MKETWLKTEIGPIHIAEENGKLVACNFCQTVGEKQENENSSRFQFKPKELLFKKVYGKNCKKSLMGQVFHIANLPRELEIQRQQEQLGWQIIITRLELSYHAIV